MICSVSYNGLTKQVLTGQKKPDPSILSHSSLRFSGTVLVHTSLILRFSVKIKLNVVHQFHCQMLDCTFLALYMCWQLMCVLMVHNLTCPLTHTLVTLTVHHCHTLAFTCQGSYDTLIQMYKNNDDYLFHKFVFLL